ncbi:MAG: SMI1/KNR4 family protein [Halanaerobiales bacterium]|nr:SMI1/KNR4 family protein [Halanaerobiales bacterium]
MISIKGNNIKVDLKDIKMLEDKFGVKLPREYVEFLKKYNGGIPESNILENDDVSISINVFYGIGLDAINDLIVQSEQLIDRISRECLPIARAEGGDILCLALSKEKAGKVFLWEHEKEIDKNYCLDIDKMLFVAKSFEELLLKVLSYDVENVDMNDFKVKNIWVDPDFLKELQEKDK